MPLQTVRTIAAHIKAMPPGILRMSIIKAAIWKQVLTLPPLEAGITTPLAAATKRNPVTINSLVMMTITIQAGSLPSSIRASIAAITKTLSAKESMKMPKVVTILYFLAI